MLNDKNMKTITHIIARELAMVLLALFTVSPAWAQFSGAGTEDNPYLINNAYDWATFTESINSGTGNADYYLLTSDITLGTEESPLTTVVGTDDNSFNGKFDGGFHTLHIYMNRDENYAAPFGVTNGATIKNLKVDGTIISDHKFAAGIVAYSNNPNNRSTNIINCISSVVIICDNIITVQSGKPFDCTHGGLVGQNEEGILNFEHCIFDGLIVDTREDDEKKANKCTGFVAWVNNTVNYFNCTMAGVIDVKPNNDNLKNSMANFHRLAGTAKANFFGTSYYINNYTYQNMPKQGTPALTEAPSETISRKYTVDDIDYFVPAAKINENDVQYYGWTLTEDTDYLIETMYNKTVYTGIDKFSGTVDNTTGPVLELAVSAWDDTEQIGWHAISSPVNGQEFMDVTNLISTSVRHNIYKWNESKLQWQEYRNNSNPFSKFENGCGYIYRTEDNGGTIGFYGNANSGDVKCKLSKTDNDHELSGINLIGNPYPHVIYKSVAIPNKYLVAGYCTLNANGTWEYHADNVAIEAGKAILVQATQKASITLTDTDKAPSAKDSSDEIWFTIKNNSYSDVAHVEFNDGEGFHKITHYNEDAPMLYVKQNDQAYASANFNYDIQSFDLVFKAANTGRYTLSFDAKGSFSYLHLIDRLTGEDIDMLIEDEYSFIGSNQDAESRFIVRLESTYSTDNSEIISTFAWQNGNDIMVNGEGELQIFDVTGRMVINTMINGTEAINITSKGIYVMKLVGDEVKTQKIVVR